MATRLSQSVSSRVRNLRNLKTKIGRAAVLAGVALCALPGIGHAQGTAGYVTWTDPLEQAFSIEVPAGWQVQGGMYRFGSLDARPDFLAVAPDGQMAVGYGDRKTPTFAVPSPYLAAQGIKAGQTFNLGTGPVMVAPYVPGPSISEVVARNHAPCADANITGRNSRADVVDQINSMMAQFGVAGINARTDAGDVTFSCTANGQPMNGYAFAGTQLITNNAVGFWSVPFMFDFVAAPGQEALAGAVTMHALNSFQLNPAWLAQQQGTFARTNQIVESTNHAITDMIWKSWNVANGTQGPEAFARAQLGVQQIDDPVRGTVTIGNENQYNWNCGGRIVGNNSGTAPTDVNCVEEPQGH